MEQYFYLIGGDAMATVPNMEMLLYGENDGISGLIGELRSEGILNKTLYSDVKEYLLDLVMKTKDLPNFPGDDIASVIDMFIDLCFAAMQNQELYNNISELNDITEKWYNDDKEEKL